jgi:hypothetical protein
MENKKSPAFRRGDYGACVIMILPPFSRRLLGFPTCSTKSCGLIEAGFLAWNSGERSVGSGQINFLPPSTVLFTLFSQLRDSVGIAPNLPCASIIELLIFVFSISRNSKDAKFLAVKFLLPPCVEKF